MIHFLSGGGGGGIWGGAQNVVSKGLGKKKKDGAKRGRGVIKKIPSSFGVTASVICKQSTSMPKQTFLTFRINVQIVFQGKHAPGPNT